MYRALALAATVAVSPAHAEGFNGAYAGPILAYDMSAVSASAGGVTAKVSGEGVAAGGVIGYNAQLTSNVVIGAELTGQIGGAKIVDGTDTIKSDYSLSAGVRLGVTQGNVLLFAKAAYVHSGFTSNDGFTKESDGGDGFAFGAGLEVPFSSKFTGRIDYTHTSYNIDQTLFGPGVDVDFNRDQITAGLIYRF